MDSSLGRFSGRQGTISDVNAESFVELPYNLPNFFTSHYVSLSPVMLDGSSVTALLSTVPYYIDSLRLCTRVNQ